MAVPLIPILAAMVAALGATVITKRRSVGQQMLRYKGVPRPDPSRAIVERERADQPPADPDMAELLSPAFAERLEAQVRAATREAVAGHPVRGLDTSGAVPRAPAAPSPNQ